MSLAYLGGGLAGMLIGAGLVVDGAVAIAPRAYSIRVSSPTT